MVKPVAIENQLRSKPMEKKPHIADKSPMVFEIKPGGYFWCSCGLSKKQPYCDGSHSGTGFSPMYFEEKEKRRVALCLCKQTCKSPFCDGAHKNLKDADV